MMKLSAATSRTVRGDTIVEVMIVLAILGLAFAISYSTANKSLILARNAEEHSEALQLVESQVEQIRSYASTQNVTNLQGYTTLDKEFCFDKTGAVKQTDVSPTTPTDPSASCYFGIETVDGHALYRVSTEYTAGPTPSQGYFTTTISWPGLGQLPTQQEQLNYRIY